MIIPTPRSAAVARLALAMAALALLAGCGGGDKITGPSTGQLQVAISGLPSGTQASVSVSGPNGFSKTLTASNNFAGVVPGTYTVAASAVTVTGGSYTPSPPSQQVAVAASATPTVAGVAYAAPGLPAGSFNLTIDAVELTQSVQTLQGSVPLVQDRDGYLRVFIKANQVNTATPDVRVRVYNGALLQQTYTIPAPGLSVPTATDESALANSWNVSVPKTIFKTGMSLLIDVDPTNAVTEGLKSDNTWPASGTPGVQDVRVLPVLNVTFVPIRQGGLTGDVTAANVAGYADLAQRIHPVPSINTSVHGVYVASHGPLQSDDANGAWTAILNEMDALRTAEGSSRHYYGVVHTSYTSGIAGLGYVGGSEAIGWDVGQRREVFAHEIGHNMDLNHAPCGNASNPDVNFPYPDGSVGKYGVDVDSVKLKQPSSSDIMGYCPNRWISDYSYKKALSFRLGTPDVVSADRQPALLVWGRVDRSGVTLEPAFPVTTVPSLPTESGAYSVEGYDAAGRQLFAMAFAPHLIADGAAGARAFAFAIPETVTRGVQLATLKVHGPEGTALATTAAAYSLSTGDSMARIGTTARGTGRSVSVTWDGRAFPMAMVRDPRTGEVLSFGRGGTAAVESDGRELEVVLSDRVQGHTARIPVAGR